MPMSINVFANRNAVVSSPNFPERFGAQTQCKWMFNAPRGLRVKIHFDNFYLLAANNQGDCITQYLTLTDSYTGNVDGPYCGNSLPPTLISTGRSLIITLESDASDSSDEYYRGFMLKASATAQLPSPRIRDSNGRWRGYAGTQTGYEENNNNNNGYEEVATTPITLSRDLDPNDPSADIEMRNAQRNLQNNQQNRNQHQNFDYYEPIKPSFIPTRPQRTTTRRTTTIQTVATINNQPSWVLDNAPEEPTDLANEIIMPYNIAPGPGYPNNRNMMPMYPDRNIERDQQKSDVPWIAVILICVVGFIAIVILLVLLVLRWKKNKNKQPKDHGFYPPNVPGRAHRRPPPYSRRELPVVPNHSYYDDAPRWSPNRTSYTAHRTEAYR